VPPAIILIDFDHCGDKFIKKIELANFLLAFLLSIRYKNQLSGKNSQNEPENKVF